VAIRGRTRSTRGLVILLVTASLVTITIDYRQGSGGPLSKISDGLHTVVLPMQNAVSTVFHPVAAFFGGMAHILSNEQKLEDQRNQIARLKTEQVEAQSALVELENLRALLGVAKSYDFQTVGADVIGNGVSNFEWSIDIDKGSRDGVKVDMPVISTQGLVGKVVSVSPFGSQVLLITDFDSYVATRLLSQETGLVQGQGRGDMAMSDVDVSAEVDVGEPVITSGYSGGLFPAGLPVGTVSSVEVDATTGAKDIHVAPYVDFSKLDVVLVVKSFEG
jgi:rod shape-determining protein MreC